MGRQEAEEQYLKALKLGLKEYKDLQAKHANPYPQVLDELLDDSMADTAQYIGTVEIPTERVVGTKTAGRVTAFSAGFLPLLDEETEFASKWMELCGAHLGAEGIRDPILCYEYMGNFYVQEGNKRLSVLKFYGAPRISAVVYRVVPAAGEEEAVRRYYEFLDFFKHSQMYDIQFSQLGSYARLAAYMDMAPNEDWTDETRRRFRAYFQYFREAFDSLGGGQLAIKPEDALLLWLQVHPFSDLGKLSAGQLKKSLGEMWDNVIAAEVPEPVVRTEAPSTEGKASLLNWLIHPDALNVAFVHQRTPETSPWTNAHDIGRQHLEKVLGKAVKVRSYFGADTAAQAEEALEQAVAEGAEVVFSTTPQLVDPSLKVSIRYPKVRFLNCSVHMPYSTVHPYYCRVYEGKFITGAIAGAIADNNKIGYVGSYPIYGVPASINAFALGAQLTNPRAQIELKWSCLPGKPTEEFLEKGIWVISNRDNPVSDRLFTEYGTYSVEKNGDMTPLGSPCWLWGKFYEKVIRSILLGTWDTERRAQAVNDWWGMSSGVIDVALAENLPEGVKNMARILREGLKNGTLDPFCRKIIAQDGSVKNDGTRRYTMEELLHMDWLCENVNGHIPAFEELLPISQPTVRMLGIYRDSIPMEETPV